MGDRLILTTTAGDWRVWVASPAEAFRLISQALTDGYKLDDLAWEERQSGA